MQKVYVVMQTALLDSFLELCNWSILVHNKCFTYSSSLEDIGNHPHRLPHTVIYLQTYACFTMGLSEIWNGQLIQTINKFTSVPKENHARQN